MKKGKLIIFSGPSGVGKTSVEKVLFKNKTLNLHFSCSATTRKQRAGEINGEHYFFISDEEFNDKIKENKFIEWNQHFSNKYGTLKTEINEIIKIGKNPFLEVETNGAVNIMKQYNSDEIISIFMKHPSISELENRIRTRGTETEKQIKLRIKRVQEEMSLSHNFKYIVTNDDIDEVISKIEKIIKAELSYD